jgi:hypothetical protein
MRFPKAAELIVTPGTRCAHMAFQGEHRCKLHVPTRWDGPMAR